MRYTTSGDVFRVYLRNPAEDPPGNFARSITTAKLFDSSSDIYAAKMNPKLWKNNHGKQYFMYAL
jgi:hypothetical protein